MSHHTRRAQTHLRLKKDRHCGAYLARSSAAVGRAFWSWFSIQRIIFSSFSSRTRLKLDGNSMVGKRSPVQGAANTPPPHHGAAPRASVSFSRHIDRASNVRARMTTRSILVEKR